MYRDRHKAKNDTHDARKPTILFSLSLLVQLLETQHAMRIWAAWCDLLSGELG